MTAPALIMLAHGSTDHLVTETTHHLRHRMQTLRPDLEVSAAFIDHCPPTGPQVVSTLVNRGATEIVFVPLLLASAIDHDPGIDVLVDRVKTAYPDIRFAVSRPLGPEACFLNVLDERLRSALTAARVTELDGLILSHGGPCDVRGAALLARRARQWGTHHRLACVTATADSSGIGIVPAMESLHAQGRRHIAVGSFFLAPDQSFESQAHQALHLGAVAVSSPIGADDSVLDTVIARYAFAAMDLLDLDETPEDTFTPMEEFHSPALSA
ncbi:MAG: hypothetical protein LBM23_10920 [Propionibacteriaceae bacterium]|jgi:sirohydrochlorin ferrochelatase|nr:hypothetical protein [Propionibacteriaceae bacterium]